MHIAQVVQDKNYLRTMRTFQVRRQRPDVCAQPAWLGLSCVSRCLWTQENFDSSHRQLLETLNAYATVEAEPHLTNLCSRLDFNGYFARLYSSGAAGEGAGEAGTQRGLVSSVYRQT